MGSAERSPDRADETSDRGAGRMSQRLEQMAVETPSRNLAEAGFSEELKQRLLDRVSKSAYHEATAEVAWKGTESLPDGVFRMLDDAHKPLKIRAGPPPVDLRIRKKTPQTPGRRLANARDQTSVYTLAQEANLSPVERESLRKELKERFTSGARAMPNSIQGLSALANERIEDAIGRGQFKNIQRGKGVNVETEYNANSPFLDTTEYFMNKMIQKQEIVPPWIEKQQELGRAAHVFRSRLRSDWRRHAARTISSQGGCLAEQIDRAEQYARAEQSASDAPPFRDETYLSTERAYHELSIKSLNSLTRSYNLQAPEIAKKPYFRLDRELQACFVEVAPQVAEEIRQRALKPSKSAASDHSRGMLDSITGPAALVRDDPRPHYGFSQLWRDIWRSRWA